MSQNVVRTLLSSAIDEYLKEHHVGWMARSYSSHLDCVLCCNGFYAVVYVDTNLKSIRTYLGPSTSFNDRNMLTSISEAIMRVEKGRMVEDR